MRCDEVMRELNLPGDDRDDRALAHHLAECEACARWSEHAAAFSRLWAATRPVDPPTDSWDRLWSLVTARLDRLAPVAAPRSRSDHSFSPGADSAGWHSSPVLRPWRGLAAIGLVGLAQAAALLVAVNLYWNPGPREARPHAPRSSTGIEMAQQTAPSLDTVVDVEWGQVILIRSGGPNKVETTDLALLVPWTGEDPWYDLYNRVEVESASAVVAMTE
jgi:hypothetical protein